MKICITGAAGFIGSHLVDHFLQHNYSVVGLDNFSTGSRKNIESFLDNVNFTFLEGDIRNLDTCFTAVKDCEVVLHQAALGSVPRSIKNPILSNEVNISGFLNVLEACRLSNVKRFIYAASSSTYGDSKKLPKIEEEIGAPLSPYAITKYVNELLANVYSKTYGIECIGLRYFNVFGPRQSPTGAYAAVIPLWINNLMSQTAPTINGDGLNSRDFTYVDNVVLANSLAVTAGEEVFGKQLEHESKSQVFNVACGERTSLNDLYHLIKTAIMAEMSELRVNKPIYGPNREGDIPHSLANIDKARTFLKYKPVVNVETGIYKTCSWFLKEID